MKITGAAYPSELIPDAELEQLPRSICTRPGMFGLSTPAEVCVYLEGFNHARSRGPFIGLHQWLVVRADHGNYVHWPGLIEAEIGDHPHDEAIAKPGQLLIEFIAYRRENGLTKIYHRYTEWLLGKAWHEGQLR